MVNRRMRWWGIHLGILTFLIYPVLWLWNVPAMLRRWSLESRAREDVAIDLDAISAVRWFACEYQSMASGWETSSYFEVSLHRGERVVVLDDFHDTFKHALAAHALLPATPTWLGQASTTGPLMIWIATVGALGLLLSLC
jgi:hypothetical protein